MLKGMATLTKVADRLTGSASTALLINCLISEYGKVSNLKIDADKKVITCSLWLNGEESPLKLNLRYHLQESNGSVYLVIEDAHTNREWINTLFKNFLVNKPFELTEEALFLKDFLS